MAEWLVRWRKRDGVEAERIYGNLWIHACRVCTYVCTVGFMCRRERTGGTKCECGSLLALETLDDDGLYSCRRRCQVSRHCRTTPVTHVTYRNEIPLIKFSSWKPRACMSHISSRQTLRLQIDRIKIRGDHGGRGCKFCMAELFMRRWTENVICILL